MIPTPKECVRCYHTYTAQADIDQFRFRTCRACCQAKRKIYNAKRRQDPDYIEYNRDKNKIYQRMKYDREQEALGRPVKHIVTNFDVKSIKIDDYRGYNSWGMGLTELFSM